MASYQAGRIISFAALLMSLWMCWLGVSRLTTSRYARWVVVILAASTANILFWGTTGQVDMLACCFSLAAFVSFLKFRERGNVKALALAGLLVVLAVFTKQTFLAAGVTIGLTLLWDAHRRRTSPLAAAVWIASVGFLGVSIALALNAATDGGYFKQAIFANMNPLEWLKLQQHIYYLILTGSGVILTAMVGAWYLSRRTAPLYVYAAFATGIWLLTAPKTGSDLNYQIEMMFVFSMCAACALDQVDFFPSLFSARRTWVTLLQVPLMLHVFLNLLLTGRNVAERVIFDSIKGQETAALKPFVERPGLLLSGQYDALVQYRGRIEVEPYIYILLVRAGIIDPEPLRKDLETRQFATIILGGPLAPGGHAAEENLELVTLPDAQLDAIRRNYRVVKHIDGPHDLYVYEPRRD